VHVLVVEPRGVQYQLRHLADPLRRHVPGQEAQDAGGVAGEEAPGEIRVPAARHDQRAGRRLADRRLEVKALPQQHDGRRGREELAVAGGDAGRVGRHREQRGAAVPTDHDAEALARDAAQRAPQIGGRVGGEEKKREEPAHCWKKETLSLAIETAERFFE
jgi:hypothetical protein